VRRGEHVYVDRYDSCQTCGLPEANSIHRVVAAVSAA
jgi:ribosomal protein L37E